jgi:hypothetical protein
MGSGYMRTIESVLQLVDLLVAKPTHAINAVCDVFVQS